MKRILLSVSFIVFSLLILASCKETVSLATLPKTSELAKTIIPELSPAPSDDLLEEIKTEIPTPTSEDSCTPEKSVSIEDAIIELASKGENLLNGGLYDYSPNCVVYQGLFKILNKEYKYQRVYYIPCQPNTEYSMRYYDDDLVCFLASSATHPSQSNFDGALSGVMSNRFDGKAINRILTVKTGKDDKYLIFAYNLTEIDNAASDDRIDLAYKKHIDKTVIKKGDSLVISGYENENGKDVYYHDSHYTEGIWWAEKKTALLSQIRWTPINDMPSMTGGFASGITQNGLPYSSVKALNKFIGIDVLLETYITALQNPNSILYGYDCKDEKVNNLSLVYDSSLKKNVLDGSNKVYNTASQINASCYYGTVCSSLVGYALGLPTYETTYSWANRNMEQIPLSVDDMRSGDVVVQYHPETGGGHTVIVLDVVRNKEGVAEYVTFAESNYSNCHISQMTSDEFRVTYLVKSSWNEYKGAKIYRYTNLNTNVIESFSYSILYSDKDGDALIYLDDRFDSVGCVFVGDTELFGYEYDSNTKVLDLNITVAEVGKNKITVCHSDTDRSLMVDAGQYNYGNGAICLDKGNKSVYESAETIKITVFENKGGEYVVLSRDGNKTVQYSVADGKDMQNGTRVISVSAKGLSSGYYVCTLCDKDGNSIGTQELMIYKLGKTAIENGYDKNGVIVFKNGKIQGKVISYDNCLKPLYVSRVNSSGVVYDTAEIAADGSFSISGDENPGLCYIKIHYACNYGRVATPAYYVYKGTNCK